MRIALVFILAFFSVTSYSQAKSDYQLETVASGLDYPWSIAFLPSGDYLVTLRGGEIRRVSASGVVSEPLAGTPESYVASQGGYFDIVLDPNFDINRQVFLSFAYGSAEANATRIVKARLADDASRLENVTPIFTVSPTKDTAAHYGGKLLFLSDGTLMMTTGDGFEYREAAQDKFSQLGKIVRLNTDGSVPADNPFADGEIANPYVYSLGHRSPQGLAKNDSSNVIYMHEHGPQGGDEVNLVNPGSNYGWPATSYGINYSGALVTPLKSAAGIQAPVKVWVPSIAPSGLAYCACDSFPAWKNSLFVGALVDKDVRRLQLKGNEVISEESLFAEISERIRDVRVGRDGNVYILTDSEAGSVIRVSPK